MKKLVIILGFFAVMMGFAVWEIVTTTKFYKETVSLLGELEDSFAIYEETLDDPQNLNVLEKLENHWFGKRNIVLMFGNHTVVREFTRRNELSDAMVSLRQAQRYITDLMHDVYPNIGNLL